MSGKWKRPYVFDKCLYTKDGIAFDINDERKVCAIGFCGKEAPMQMSRTLKEWSITAADGTKYEFSEKVPIYTIDNMARRSLQKVLNHNVNLQHRAKRKASRQKEKTRRQALKNKNAG